jgi:hypothetical protein
MAEGTVTTQRGLGEQCRGEGREGERREEQRGRMNRLEPDEI